MSATVTAADLPDGLQLLQIAIPVPIPCSDGEIEATAAVAAEAVRNAIRIRMAEGVGE